MTNYPHKANGGLGEILAVVVEIIALLAAWKGFVWFLVVMNGSGNGRKAPVKDYAAPGLMIMLGIAISLLIPFRFYRAYQTNLEARNALQLAQEHGYLKAREATVEHFAAIGHIAKEIATYGNPGSS